MTDKEKLDAAYAILANAIAQTAAEQEERFCEATCGLDRKPDRCPWYYEVGGGRGCYYNDAQHLVEIMEARDDR